MIKTQIKTKAGEEGYINQNCWLARNTGYPPSKRCQYCDLKFNKCLFSRYLLISLILVSLLLVIAYLVDSNISKTLIVSIFVLVIVYGYFFNKSTENIVEANFSEKTAKEAFRDLSANLKKTVVNKTKDLTKTNKELEAKNQLNQELLIMKSDFLRVVNHQLNTPISIMRGYYSMIEEGSYTTEKALPVIKIALERINLTVADFWNAYELEGERMKMNPERVDVTTVVEKMVLEKKDLQYAKDRKLTLSVEPPKFKVPIVWCDLKKITHVISNLLDNAVFYTYKGGIVVSYEVAGDYLKINVKDTGNGITEEDKKKIFQKFSRGTGASGMHPDGSGLGLYIAKKIVEGNGGEISFASDGVDKGTTFSFTIPVYIDQQTGNPGDVVTRENKVEIFN